MPTTIHGYAVKDPKGFLLHEWFHKSKDYIRESLEGNFSKLQAEKMLRLGYKIVPATMKVCLTQLKVLKDRLCLGCSTPIPRKAKRFFCIECVDLWANPQPKGRHVRENHPRGGQFVRKGKWI